jgi:hypothetical protein
MRFWQNFFEDGERFFRWQNSSSRSFASEAGNSCARQYLSVGGRAFVHPKGIHLCRVSHAVDSTRRISAVKQLNFSSNKRGYASAISRHGTPELRYVHRPSKSEGAGNAGCWPQPMARLQKSKQAAVTTGSAKSSGIPCATVLTLIARSPWEPGFLVPIAHEIIIPRAWPQRREARTTRLCVRFSAVRPHE